MANIFGLLKSTASSAHALNPSDDVAMQQFPQQQIFLRTIIVGIVLVHNVVAKPPLTVSVFRAYLNKDPCIRSSLQSIPEAFVRVLLTFVCLKFAYIGVLISFLIVPSLFGIIIINLLRIPQTFLGLFLFPVIVAIPYFIVLWSLAPTVAILEQKWGFDALRRSAYLMNGRKRVWLCLVVSFLACIYFYTVCLRLFPIFIPKENLMAVRFCVAALSVVIWSLLYLSSVTSTVVFYFSCKEYHKESTETLPTTTQSSCGHRSFEYKTLTSPNHESVSTTVDV